MRILCLIGILLPLTVVAAPVTAPTPGPVLPSLARKKALRVGMYPGTSPFVALDAAADDLRRIVGDKAPPATATVDGHRVAGFDVDLMVEAARALDLPLEVVLVDKFEDLLTGLQAGRYDIAISAITRTLDRAITVAFSDPYFSTGLVLLTRHPERFATFESVRHTGVKVAFRRGTTAAAFVEENLPECTRVPGTVEELTKLIDSDGPESPDVFAVDYLLARDLEVRHQTKATLSSVEERRYTVEQLAFAVRQGDGDWLNWLNLYLRQIRSAGSFHKIAARYNLWFRTER